MKIMAWLRNAMNTIRTLLIQICLAPLTLWRGVRTWVADRFQRNKETEPLVDEPESIEERRSFWRRIGDGIRHLLTLARKGFVELFQPFFARIFRLGKAQTGLIIRKISVSQKYHYNSDSNPSHQLFSDTANALAIVIGLGTWPYQQSWIAQFVSPILAPHYWGLSALLGAFPLLVLYRHWQSVRQQSGGVIWDVLTLSTSLIGLFLLLFAGMLMFNAFTGVNVEVATIGCAVAAILTWVVGESTNTYAIWIHRPRPLPTLFSLNKSLLFILSGWLILLYLLLVNNLFLLDIQLESAFFLFVIFCIAAVLGLLLALISYGLRQFNIKLPRFVSTTN